MSFLLYSAAGLQSELEKLVTQLQESQRNRERVEAERDDLKRVTEKHLKDQERVQVRASSSPKSFCILLHEYCILTLNQ